MDISSPPRRGYRPRQPRRQLTADELVRIKSAVAPHEWPVIQKIVQPPGTVPPCTFDATQTAEEIIQAVDSGDVVGKECAHLPNVQTAYRRMMARAASSLPDAPGGFDGRGIVMAGGGIYFDALYVSIRMIRHVGCNLPVEVWHLGSREMLPWQRKLLAQYDVTTVDATAVDAPVKPAGGWPLKPFAVLNSRFEQVLFLDADCYPARDPSFLFDAPQLAEAGAIFWADRTIYENKPIAFEALGLPRAGRPIESGQFVVDKRRVWREMSLAWWMNQPRNAPYYYALFHGEKESYRYAWQYLGSPMAMPELEYEVSMPAMLGHDFEGRWLFVHRCCGKMTLANRNVFSTNASESTRNDRLPHEAQAWGFLEELRGHKRGMIKAMAAAPVQDCGCGKPAV